MPWAGRAWVSPIVFDRAGRPPDHALSVSHLPARIDPGFLVGRRERRAAEDMVRSLLAGHDRGCVEVAVGHAWKDRGVGDAQALDADDAALRIDDACEVVGAAHPAGAAGVVGALGMVPDEGVELVV